MGVEKSSGEKVSPCSSVIRRCVRKFRLDSFLNERSYKKEHGTGPSTLQGKIASMTSAGQKRWYKQIMQDGYGSIPYKDVDHFVRDVAPICKEEGRIDHYTETRT